MAGAQAAWTACLPFLGVHAAVEQPAQIPGIRSALNPSAKAICHPGLV